MKMGVILYGSAVCAVLLTTVVSVRAQEVPDRYKDPADRPAAMANLPDRLTVTKVPPLRALCRQDPDAAVDRIYYDDGSLYLEVGCRAGKRHGKLRVFRRDGQLWSQTDYADDVREGTDVTYYPDGTVQEEQIYVNGLRDGQRRQYYADGTPKRDSFFRAGQKVRSDIGYLQKNGDVANAAGAAEQFEAR